MRKLVLLLALIPALAFGQPQERHQGHQQRTAPAKTMPQRGHQMERQQVAPRHQDRVAPAQRNVNVNQNRNTNVNRNTRDTRVDRHTRTDANVNVNRNTNINRNVNVTEFRERHREVFSLGRHDVNFFYTRFGYNHVRLIGGIYFVYVDGCWVSVNVDGYGYYERVICPDDPEYIYVY